ncbi:TniB family NTP-binding protein [Comamonas kerstersii]|uniref:TniB family NTP-binding protein n=1 Tax=Comamonas kerstersii TaxID=225992 RepID=UPI000986ED89|nr:TniB family NTP-binding protein [Comamonas kerstersii]OOH84712.1 transposition helper protein [Comamonas kerstersii]OOH90740.1 transposition helper protein [Comamonas kerstersii]
MTPAKALRKAIETCELQHPEFRKHAEVLSSRIEDALAGYAPRIEWVVGPSRVGKSMLINLLSRLYPPQRVDGKKSVPVLVVSVPAGISPSMLPSSVLTALGVPLPQKSSNAGLMSMRLLDQLRLAGTRVIIFEEASHIVEPGARVPPRGAADWLKELSDKAGITIFMFGVPRLERLFASNEQLRTRASTRREFRPYDVRQPEQFRDFAVCVNTYAQLFQKHGYPIQVSIETLVQHCYLLSGGLIGILSRLMQELACLVGNEAPRELHFHDCANAAESVEGTGHPAHPAFMKPQVSPVELTQAHIHTLESNGMTVPRLPQLQASA